MNPDIAIPVLVAVLFLAATLAFVVLDRQEERKYEPRHHHPAGPRHAFADPRDATDPDGDQFVEELHHDWWAEPAPGGKVEVLTGPLAEAGRLAPLSREECEATAAAFAAKYERKTQTAAAADTGEINIAVAEWGMSAQAKAAELAAKYLTAEVSTP